MLFELWNIIAPVFICTTIGYFWARSSTPFSADFVSRIVMNIGAPCLVISTINGVEISGQDFYAVVFAHVHTYYVSVHGDLNYGFVFKKVDDS